MQQETLYMNIGGLHDYASIFHLIFDIFYLNSSGHVLLLCGVRYLVTVYPIHSRQHLTVKAVGFCSLSMWVLCILFAVFAYIMRTNKKLYSIISCSIYYLILLVFVSFIMISLHVKKLTAIQQSPCETRRIERRWNCFHDYYYFCSFACISNCKKCIYVHPLVHTHVIICPLFILGCYQCFTCICELFL